MLDSTCAGTEKGQRLPEVAIRAWHRLFPHLPVTRVIAIKGESINRKSAVCRLEGTCPSGTLAIAKRCRAASAELEHRVYMELLPALRVPRIRSLGIAADEDLEFRWLFLEDAGQQLAETESAVAARWLGQFQTSVREPFADLPDRTEGHYLHHLSRAAAHIDQAIDDPALQDDWRGAFVAMRSMLEAVQAQWESIRQACHVLPQTMVHGDFAPKNLHLRSVTGGTEMVAVDWEMAGWGTAAVDLGTVSARKDGIPSPEALTAYAKGVQPAWGRMDMNVVAQAANAGVILRALAAIDWATQELRYGCFGRPARRLLRYHERIRRALGALG